MQHESNARRYHWRLWASHGGHRLDQAFDTPTAAGAWRGRTHGVETLPLTLIAVERGERRPVSPLELEAAQTAWLIGAA